MKKRLFLTFFTTHHSSLITGLVCLVLSTAGCQPTEISKEWHRIDPPAPAFDFTLETLDGNRVSLSDYRGGIVLMEFWATWCGPCRYSTPSLEVIYKKYRDRGVTVLLVNQGEKPEVITKWAEGRFTATFLLDPDGAVGARYGVSGIPKLFILNQDGNIVYAHGGYGAGLERNLALILNDLLGDTPPT